MGSKSSGFTISCTYHTDAAQIGKLLFRFSLVLEKVDMLSFHGVTKTSQLQRPSGTLLPIAQRRSVVTNHPVRRDRVARNGDRIPDPLSRGTRASRAGPSDPAARARGRPASRRNCL